MANLRVNYVFGEPLTGGDPSLRVDYVFAEPYTGGSPNLDVNYIFAEPYTRGYPLLRVNYIVVEMLCPVDPEEVIVTTSFPGFGNSSTNNTVPAGADPFNTALPGLTFSVHKKPGFNTRMSKAASGFEVRNALMEYPEWEFELTYDFLEDSSGAESSLKTIVGYFLSSQGSYARWLFKDPDDYLCVNSTCGYPDGVTTTFFFCREMVGGYREKVGQVDDTNTITLYLTVTESHTIPATPGPYTITVGGPIVDGGVTKTIGGTALTRVSGAPANNQYSVNETTGVYTFNSANQNIGVEITFRSAIDPADYTITLPNLITFDSAPAEGTLSADFQFFFICRFTEDQMDFEKFADKLWNLQECNFKSLIL